MAVGMAGTASAVSTPGSPVIVAAALQADAAVLRRAFETLHPGLYRYRSKARIDEAFAALESQFARDRTVANAGPVPDAGLEPDVYVQPSVEDIAAGRDVELAEALRRIEATRD